MLFLDRSLIFMRYKMYFFSRKFFPFLSTGFLGAFNDNIFRYALSIMIAYQCAYTPEKASMLTFLATALLMFPQFPFSALAGEIADKFSQKKCFFWIKAVEVLLMILALTAFLFRHVPLLLFLLFLMGTQSAFFSPLKYSYIQRNTPDDLVRGNAYMNAATYIAILSGMVAGIFLISLSANAPLYTGLALCLTALAGFCTALFIPEKAPVQPTLTLHFNPVKATLPVMKMLLKNPILRKCALGLSIFWMAGALYVSQLAPYCKNILQVNTDLVIFFTLLFSAGVALGAFLCGLLRKKKNIAMFISPALLLMALFTLDLFFASHSWKPLVAEGGTLPGLTSCFSLPSFWRITLDLLFLAACGGFYSVPLSALLQKEAPADSLARVVAGNNLLNATLIVAGSLVTGALVGAKLLTIEGIFILIAVLNLGTAFYLFSLRKYRIGGEESPPPLEK